MPKIKDPRTEISFFRDEIPILMMPVRLETRFRQGPAPELLVRVYPDDCSIDSFEPELSANEIDSARKYWLAVYAAGLFPDQERGAWRALAGAYGSGRAQFILERFQPLDPPPAARPKKSRPEDLLLTIAADVPPSSTEADALLAYWTAAWRARGRAKELELARSALVGVAGGDKQADALLDRYAPSNFRAKGAPGIGVETTFVVFPPEGKAKARSWSRAATAELMPDVFVFIGINGGVQEVVELGEPVLTPLVVSPDPSAPEASQLRHDKDGSLIFPDDMLWMVDFDRAVKSGMGFRIRLTPAQASRGFERVLVVGIRGSDEKLAATELETLIAHQRSSRAGYAVVPQGTPTNNTDGGSSGWSRTDDPDESFDAMRTERLFTDTPVWLDKADGQWLTELLGLSPSAFGKVANSDGRDQADARAMNAALWPATMGYWMHTMMSPIFDDATTSSTREFFTNFVLGRGALPAVRIGNQPYGILPATAYSRMLWPSPSEGGGIGGTKFLDGLYRLVRTMDNDWKAMAGSVSFSGKPGDPHKILLDILGLHAGSVEFTQRYAESTQQLYNRLSIDGLGPLVSLLIVAGLVKRATDELAVLGYTGTPPDIISKFFLGEANPLHGPLIDDRPLSESAPIRKYTADGAQNYIEWLIAASRTSLDALYQQEGFRDDKPPEALLYLLLRHALQLGYHDTSVQLHLAAGLLTDATARDARIDETFINVRQTAKPFESKYGLLYKPELAITGDRVTTVGDFIGRGIGSLPLASGLRAQLDALERLQNASTARLERAFAEHIDVCSYRLDAWLLGLVNYQLTLMRNVQETSKGPRKEGLYLGAYAWLEDLKPDNRVLEPVTFSDPALEADFAGGPPLVRDSTNEGFIHAPSVNHAVAAAVLRNGYIANASSANPTSMAVNLTSDRVRTALGILEGIRGGQSLGALLGYQLERGLHDDHGLAGDVELDEFVFKLRREFPINSNRQSSTRIDDDALAIESVEARNVVDGLALVNHVRATGNATYPFGKPRLKRGTAAQEAALTFEVGKMLEAWDAVADLALAEGVFQATVGNYDRVASTLDAYGKGAFPPEPLIVRTPDNGLGLTHRVAIHLVPGAAAAGATPRAVAEPALDRWLATVLPPMNEVGCLVDYRDASNAAQTREVLLSELHVGPSDLLQLLREDQDRALAELDERVLLVVAPLARPDGAIAIRYMEKSSAAISVFELSALVRHLRRLLSAARPLRNTDLSMSKDARRDDDADVSVDRARVGGPRATLATLLTDLNAFEASELQPRLDDDVANRATILTKIDDWIEGVVPLLARAALFSIPQSGWGFAYDTRAILFRKLLAKAADLVARWNPRLADYDAAIAAYDALPTATPDADRFAALARAERLVSTQVLTPVPATPADYRTALDAKRAAFVAKRDQFAALAATNRLKLSPLLADVTAALPIDDFDYPPVSIAEEADATVALAQDVRRVVKFIARECARRGAAVDTLLAQHDDAGVGAARVQLLTDAAKALFSEDFVLIPEFGLAAEQGDEIASSFGATASLLDFVTNAARIEQPVDTWLYGVARVRERLRHWEQIGMLAESFGLTAPALQPLQFPFDAADSWMALQFPPALPLDHERLLYTAHFSQPFDRTARQCGLLLDEWTEVIPERDTTTGLAFHYDKPNNEAPQTMLLLTPAAFRGQWQWNDVVDALNETLDLAKRRAVEPDHIDGSVYGQFLPATIMAVTMSQLTISANLAINNNLASFVKT